MFLLALFGGRGISDQFSNIIAPPTGFGELGIHDPSKEADFDYEDSKSLTANLTQAIFNQLQSYEKDKDAQTSVMKKIRRGKDRQWKEGKESILVGMDKELSMSLELYSEGASTYLNSLLLKKYGFKLNRREFIDALCLRYKLSLSDVPNTRACGTPNSPNQAAHLS